MTDRQMQFIAWLITTATDKCQTLEEVREMNREIREHSTGWKPVGENGKDKADCIGRGFERKETALWYVAYGQRQPA